MPLGYEVHTLVRDSLCAEIWKEEPVFTGTAVSFEFKIRDLDGELYGPPNGQVNVQIFPVDDTGVVGTLAFEGVASQVIRDGVLVPGLFRMTLDTTGYVSGSYLVRLSIPYGSAAVLAQESFVLEDLSPVPA